MASEPFVRDSDIMRAKKSLGAWCLPFRDWILRSTKQQKVWFSIRINLGFSRFSWVKTFWLAYVHIVTHNQIKQGKMKIPYRMLFAFELLFRELNLSASSSYEVRPFNANRKIRSNFNSSSPSSILCHILWQESCDKTWGKNLSSQNIRQLFEGMSVDRSRVPYGKFSLKRATLSNSWDFRWENH